MEKQITRIKATPTLRKKKRVCVYARVSLGDDDMKHSLKSQIQAYTNKIKNNKQWLLSGVYADLGISGTQNQRPEFDKMINECKKGNIDMIITKSISRFARNTLALLETTRMLKTLNISVYFEDENIDTLSKEGEVILTILAQSAQEQAKSFSENVLWRVKNQFKEGKPWGVVMLGYRYKNDRFEIHQDEAKVVRFVFDSYLQGLSLYKISRLLNETKTPSRFGNTSKWNINRVKEILTNYTYTGNLLLQKTYKLNFLTKGSKTNIGQKDKYLIENAHDPIVTIEEFNLVQQMLIEKQDKYCKPKPANRYPLTSKIKCEHCSSTFMRTTMNKKIWWCCSGKRVKGIKTCSSKNIPETIINELLKDIDINKIKVITSFNNTLKINLINETIIEKEWELPSRKQSWTDSMKEQARIRSLQNAKDNSNTRNTRC